ncbi:MAG: ribbon-helix-helix protein, CopG family [Chloroflexi bacterium]|nr:ribbon-helix-helix protein, CopG family [Chloroflexota bacterium]
MRSVRLAPALERRLAEAARQLETSESEVIRLALERYLDELQQAAAVDDLVALINRWDDEWRTAGVEKEPQTDLATSREVFGQMVWQKWQGKLGVEEDAETGLGRVAEERAAYRTSSPAD